MILTRDVILHEIAAGRLAIEPLEPDQIGPASIDLHLADEIRVMEGGLMIHVTSGFVAPGVESHQVLEMSNVAGRPLAIHAGVRVCQIVLQRCEGTAVYTGRFARQDRL